MKVSLAAARVNAGLTTNQAAEKLGVEQKTLIRWEKGRSFPKIPTLKRMLDLYGAQFDDIDFRFDEAEMGECTVQADT